MCIMVLTNKHVPYVKARNAYRCLHVSRPTLSLGRLKQQLAQTETNPEVKMAAYASQDR